MKFTLAWLKDHLETDADVPRLLDAMTMAGIEVEHVANPAETLAAFSVARIVEAVQHPNADRLRVCQVDTRDGRREIVCGAPNARAGLTTIYAPLGTYIPGSGITLEPRAVRGVVSNGMLCSGAELLVDADADGIVELPDALAVGTPAAQALGLSDAVIDVEVTPNRPDWLGVAGVARELAAAGLGRLKTAPVAPVRAAFPSPVRIRIDAPDACPVFAGRLIRGVTNGPSPDWLQQRLKAIGLRPINALADVTNYLCHDRARPLHVYDAARLTGDVCARLGREGESFLALDGKTYQVGAEMCVIADDAGVLGLGGVMGGEASGCTPATTDVFVESAWFDPLRTFQTGRATGINSDAKYRFERGVDPGFVLPGLELATRMILDLCGGEASQVVVAGAPPEGRPPVDFPLAEVARLTGLSCDAAEIDRILTDLGFDPQPAGEGRRRVVAPSWRRDVEGPADLVEDVARIAGFDRLPQERLPEIAGRKAGVLTPAQNRARIARRAAAARGYQEAVTWSFCRQAHAALFGGGAAALVLANPIASDLDCMRPSALIHLLLAGQRSADRGFPDVALFEVGPVYAGDRPADQATVAAAIARGAPRWWGGAAAADVFSAKADLFALLDALGAPVAGLQVTQGARAWWHPGRSGQVKMGPKTLVAEFGELHPRVLKALGVDGPVAGFELTLDALPAAKAKAGKARARLAASDLMPLTRDFAFLIDAGAAAGDLVRAVATADKALIAGVSVFDVYAGKGVPEGKVSLGLEVRLQPAGKTLTETEIEEVAARVVAAAGKLGAALRG